jgi:hypothetical protein
MMNDEFKFIILTFSVSSLTLVCFHRGAEMKQSRKHGGAAGTMDDEHE